LKIPWRRVLIICLSVLVLLSIVYSLAFSAEPRDMSSDSDGATGTSRMKAVVEDRGLSATAILSTPAILKDAEDPSRSVYVSIGRGRGYTETEVQQIMKFHSRGGRLLILDDGGRASGITRRFDIDIIGGQLYDESYLEVPDLVQVDVNWRDFAGTIVLNRPTAMALSGGEVLARTGPASWLDKNGNGLRDPENVSAGEFPGQKIVAVLTDPEFQGGDDGVALFISDPSVFANDMLDRGDNERFLIRILDLLLPEGGRVYIDDSTHRNSGARSVVQSLMRGAVYLTTDVNAKIVVGTLSTVLLVAIVYLHPPLLKLKHITYLDRSGLAQLIDRELGEQDVPQMRKLVLDTVRIRNSLTVESFSRLSWEDIGNMVGDRTIMEFVRTGKAEDLEETLGRIERWRRG